MAARRNIWNFRVRNARTHADLIQLAEAGGAASPIGLPVVPCATVNPTGDLTLGHIVVSSATFETIDTVKPQFGIVQWVVLNIQAGTTLGVQLVVTVGKQRFPLPSITPIQGEAEILEAGWVDQVELRVAALVGIPRLRYGYSLRLGTQ